MVMSDENENIRVEITDASEVHCFKLTLNANRYQGAMVEAPAIEIMLHARSLVDLIHKCSTALCDWQAQTAAKYCEELKEFLAKKW
jgi:hypothetical protein